VVLTSTQGELYHTLPYLTLLCLNCGEMQIAVTRTCDPGDS